MTIQTTSVEDAAIALASGRPVVFPTETVYGLGVSVIHARSLDDLYSLKSRDRGKPIAWLVADADDLCRFGREVPSYARALADAFWPGPLTLIVDASDEVPRGFRSAEGTIGLRMPGNLTALDLVRKVGGPIATTSANEAGCAAPQAVGEIAEVLAESVGIVVSDHSDKSGVASTILDCTGDQPRIVREGAITAADIAVYS